MAQYWLQILAQFVWLINRQDGLVKSVAQNGKTGGCQLAALDATLLECQRCLNKISEFVGPFATILDALAVEFGDLDVEELLGLMDCGLLVRGLKTLGVGLALEEAAHLPISAGIGLEDTQFGRVVGNGCD